MRLVGVVLILTACGFSGARFDGGAPLGDADRDATASVADASGFDPTNCPSAYVDIGIVGSRYRELTSLAVFWSQHDACNADVPGWTHLAIVNTPPEAAALAGLVAGTTRFYVGGSQTPGQTQLAAGWLRFDGEPVTTPWNLANDPPEPNDGPDAVEDEQENLLAMEQDGLLTDVSGRNGYRAACECDGRGVHPSVVIPPQ